MKNFLELIVLFFILLWRAAVVFAAAWFTVTMCVTVYRFL